jgi:hypothetical protein
MPLVPTGKRHKEMRSMQKTHHSEPYREWPSSEPVSRNFDCEIVTPHVGPDGLLYDTDARLKLTTHTFVIDLGEGHCGITIVVPSPKDIRHMTNLQRSAVLKPVWDHLDALGLNWNSPGAGRPGTWRRYLHEVAKMHAALDFLAWTLTPEEQALVDAVDAYAEKCPQWVLRRIQEADAA